MSFGEPGLVGVRSRTDFRLPSEVKDFLPGCGDFFTSDLEDLWVVTPSGDLRPDALGAGDALPGEVDGGWLG